MARGGRQAKILEIISIKEIETQEELARELKMANYDITQATISRDIKELGLTKVLSNTGKYKYCLVSADEQIVSNKYITIFKEVVVSIKPAMNLVVLRTMKGMAQGLASFVDKLNISQLLGATSGEDTVLLIFPTVDFANEAVATLSGMLN